MVLEQLSIHMDKIEIGFPSPTKHKNQFQLIKYVKCERQKFNTFRTKYERISF